jgi:hypothetical protein
MLLREKTTKIRRAVVETLESRQLLSVTIPDGYVKISGEEAISINSRWRTEQSPKQTGIILEEGANYFFVASGTHVLASSSGREADANYFEQVGTSNWTNPLPTANVHLRVTGVSSWGSYQSDHIYGAFATGDGNELKPWISDSNYTDNVGNLYLEVYQEVVLKSMTVQDVAAGSVTVPGGQTAFSESVYSPGASESDDWETPITISATLSVNTAEAWAMAKYQIVMADGSVFETGQISASGVDATVPFPGPIADHGFEVRAWIDTNQNGEVDGNESVTELMKSRPWPINGVVQNASNITVQIWNDTQGWKALGPNERTPYWTEDWDFIYVPETGHYYKVEAWYVSVDRDAVTDEIRVWRSGVDNSQVIINPLPPTSPRPIGP